MVPYFIFAIIFVTVFAKLSQLRKPFFVLIPFQISQIGLKPKTSEMKQFRIALIKISVKLKMEIKDGKGHFYDSKNVIEASEN